MISLARHAKFAILLSLTGIALAMAALVSWGLPLGIDFTGGTLVTATLPRAQQEKLTQALREHFRQDITTQLLGENEILLRLPALQENERQGLRALIQKTVPTAKILRVESVGPTIGAELRRSAFLAVSLAVGGIIIYIAWAFRGLKRSLSPWLLGFTAVLALIHDVIIITGFFALWGKLFNVTVDVLFVTALLATLGYSVNDTIVLFNRLRYLMLRESLPLVQAVNRAIALTITRSFNTSLTTLFVMAALLLFGSTTLRWFIVALSLGVIVGTYSSIVFAGPFVVWWHQRRHPAAAS
jgi:preprotein translocase SecF subunit